MTELELLSRPEDTLASAKQRMEKSGVMDHRFLKRFRVDVLSRDQLRTFAVLWYKTARLHKLAFPALIWNVPDDDVRFDLIDILREEYGDGDRSMIHARLLLRFLSALGVTEGDVETAPTPLEIEQFGREVLATWRDAAPAQAFGLHFALEYLASALHVYFADGLLKYDFLTRHDREYFEYHRVAEEQHADHSEAGFLFYAETEDGQALLTRGVEEGLALLRQLWTAFERLIPGFQPELSLSQQ